MAKKQGMALPSKPAKAEPKPPPHSKSADAGYKPTFRGGRKPAEEEEAFGMAEDRKSVYDEYLKTQAGASSEEPAEKPETSPAADEPEVPPVEETPEPEPEVPEHPETPPVEGEEPPVKKAEEKSKVVPHEALHEEREKHKATRAEREALKAENQELQKRQDELLRSMRTLTEKVDAFTKAPKTTEPPAPITDPEAAIRQLQTEIASLKGETETFKQQTAEQRRATMVQDLNTRIATTNAELEKEGIKGFNYFLDQVTVEVRKQMKPDGSNAAQVDIPDNWKKIYKESVYPKIKGMFAPEVKAAKVEEKKVLKREAGLVGQPGAAESKAEPEKKGWSYNEYLEWQRKQRAS